jgi:hypothetical protein
MMVSVVNAAVTTIQPASKDAYLWQYNPTVNYGNQLLMYVGGAPNWREHTLLKFDLSSIPDGSVINSAYLRLYYNAAGSTGDPGGRTYTVHRITQDWVELECTWNIFSTGNSWTTAGGDYADIHKASLTLPSMGGQNSWVSWTVTDIVKDWINFGNPNYGFLIREEEVVGIYSAFRSTQHSDLATRPILEIDYTPPRAHVPVGGVLTSVNNLEILAPYITLAGLIVAASTLFIIKRRTD